MKDAMIYGLCLERLRHQIAKAKAREKGPNGDESILIESYLTADIEEIIEVLELYDLGDKNWEALKEKLDDLADTASVLLRERIGFGTTPEGHLGLYYVLKDISALASIMA